jgi:hypothetical protein
MISKKSLITITILVIISSKATITPASSRFSFSGTSINSFQTPDNIFFNTENGWYSLNLNFTGVQPYTGPFTHICPDTGYQYINREGNLVCIDLVTPKIDLLNPEENFSVVSTILFNSEYAQWQMTFFDDYLAFNLETNSEGTAFEFAVFDIVQNKFLYQTPSLTTIVPVSAPSASAFYYAS